MLKKSFLFPVVVIALVFFSFSYPDFVAQKLPTGEQEYSLQTPNMNIRNRPPLFKLMDNGKYFVHPASSMPAKGEFTIKEAGKYWFEFSIQKGSKVGKILFIIEKNEEEIRKFIVDSKRAKKLHLTLYKNDRLTIIADADGRNSGDWGNLQILKYESNYIPKIRLIEFLWAMFFVYFIGKRHFYIALNSYAGFLLMLSAEKMNFGQLSFYDSLIYTMFFFLMAFLFVFIYQELKFFKKLKIATCVSWIATILVYFIPIAFIVFLAVFNKPMDGDALFAIYQTNPNEAKEYIETFIPSIYWLVAIGISFVIGFLLWKQEQKERMMIERSLLLMIIFILAGLVITQLKDVRIPSLIYNSFSKYEANLNRFLEFQQKRKDATIQLNASKKERGELYVVVVGESLNKFNMGLYGYFRDTTPRLMREEKQNNLLVFTNTYSNSTNTMQSLSFALTEANQYNKKEYFQSPSFVEIFNAAGFDTYWLSRQGSLFSNPNVVSAVANTSKHPIDLVNDIHLNPDDFYSFEDARVLKSLKKTLKNRDKNKNTLIVVHIYGNHVHYQDRYPQKFEKFKKTLPYIIGTKAWYLDDYTAYDNSVYFNDYIVSNLLDMVRKEGGVSTFLYFSDHSEDVVKHHGHTAQIGGFVYEMTQIPFIAWLSPGYKKRYPQTYETFSSNRDTLFSNDMIYDTLIGLAHIKTEHYSPVYDLSSKKYHLSPNNALTLHGRKHYTAPDNYIYWKNINAKIVQQKKWFNKVILKDTDSVGKLNEAWQLGFRSFKINLFYMKDKHTFQTGTDKYDTGGNLLDTLHYFRTSEINTLVLNLANIDEANSNLIFQRLQAIDNKLNLKQKSVLIIKKQALADLFKKAGWKIARTDANLMNPVFDLADSKLKTDLSKKPRLADDNVKHILVDLTLEYDW